LGAARLEGPVIRHIEDGKLISVRRHHLRHNFVRDTLSYMKAVRKAVMLIDRNKESRQALYNSNRKRRIE